tara:strand:+ start:547 stop:723 length:177 start_codon:yes stop_codon:yes gene_type:complete
LINLVTGDASFLGFHLIDRLISYNKEVIEKAYKEISCQPQIPLDKGLEKAINYFKSIL